MLSLRRRRRQSGDFLVEMALSFLLFLGMVLGLMDLSMVVFIRGLFQHAVREGARFAITFSPKYNGLTCTTQSACIIKVVQDNSLGFLTGTNASAIKIKYYAPNDLSKAITSSDLPITLASGVKVNYINQTGNVVEVSVQNYVWRWMAPYADMFPGTGTRLGAASSDVLQGYAVGQTAPPTP